MMMTFKKSTKNWLRVSSLKRSPLKNIPNMIDEGVNQLSRELCEHLKFWQIALFNVKGD